MTTKYNLSGEYHSDVNALMNRITELEDALRLSEAPCRAYYKNGNESGWKAYSAVQEALKDRTIEVSRECTEPDRNVEAPPLVFVNETFLSKKDTK